MNRKCKVCDQMVDADEMKAWQPFGPDPRPRKVLMPPGCHYRGWPVIRVCFTCADKIRSGDNIQFSDSNYEYKLVGERLTTTGMTK